MRSTTGLLSALLALGIILNFLGISEGQSYHFKSYITVDKPVQVPGAVLQPNTKYVFRTINVEGPMQTVRILNAHETRVIADFEAVRDGSGAATRPLLTFYDTVPGCPLIAKSWFYPGLPAGLKFLYPEHERVELTAHLVTEGQLP